jgi:amidohydrolase
MAALNELIQRDLARITEIRHDLHAHPELGYAEVRTSGVVKRELEEVGICFEAGLAGGTGVLGYLPATTDPDGAPTIALRADMDALPILENTGLRYASRHEGVMHACGHDGHTSILLGVARVLSQTSRPNNVLLLFQPAEEGGAGGEKMCQDGVLDGKLLGNKADFVFGLHGYPSLQVGQVGSRVGALMASADGFSLRITGQGGHAAMPHFGVDPIVAAAQIVTALQSIASRNVSPLDSIVVTIAMIHAGTAHNVIPDEVHVEGTLRTLLPETRELGMRRIREIAEGVGQALGVAVQLEFMHGYPVTVNAPEATERFLKVAREAFGDKVVTELDPVMGAEDFSFYGRKAPACFYWLGLLNEGQERYPNLHAPEFDFNDKALPVGIEAMCRLALDQAG